MLLIIWT